MRAYPEFVGGTQADDTRLMRGVPGMLAKIGAEGVIAVALPGVGAVALKIDDGATRARMPVLVSALRRLGVDAPVLTEYAEVPLFGGGVPVGGGPPALVRLRPGPCPVASPPGGARAAEMVRAGRRGGRCDRLGTFQRDQVCGVRHVGQADGAGDLGGDPVGEPADVRDVDGAGGDEDGHLQLVEAADRRWVSSPTSTAPSASSAARARRSISSANAMNAGSRSSGRRCGPTTQNRTSPAALAAEVLRVDLADQPVPQLLGVLRPLVPETAVSNSASAATRCGYASAVSIATAPPNEQPTRAAWAMSSASSTPATSS